MLGKTRPVCDAHATVSTVQEGARVLHDLQVMDMQAAYEKTGDDELGARIARIVRRAEDADRRRAVMVYDLAIGREKRNGAAEDAAHTAALIAVWRAARYPEGDPRGGDT